MRLTSNFPFCDVSITFFRVLYIPFFLFLFFFLCVLFFSSHLHNIHWENKGIKITEKGPKIERLILSPNDERKKNKVQANIDKTKKQSQPPLSFNGGYVMYTLNTDSIVLYLQDPQESSRLKWEK